MNPPRSLRLFAALVVVSAFSLLTACTSNNDAASSQPPFSAKLVKSVDSHDLETRLKAELIRRYERLYASYIYGGSGILGASAGSTTPTSSGTTASDSASVILFRNQCARNRRG